MTTFTKQTFLDAFNNDETTIKVDSLSNRLDYLLIHVTLPDGEKFGVDFYRFNDKNYTIDTHYTQYLDIEIEEWNESWGDKCDHTDAILEDLCGAGNRYLHSSYGNYDYDVAIAKQKMKDFLTELGV